MGPESGRGMFIAVSLSGHVGRRSLGPSTLRNGGIWWELSRNFSKRRVVVAIAPLAVVCGMFFVSSPASATSFSYEGTNPTSNIAQNIPTDCLNTPPDNSVECTESELHDVNYALLTGRRGAHGPAQRVPVDAGGRIGIGHHEP